MPEKLIVIGGGEHATVVMEAVLLQPELWELLMIPILLMAEMLDTTVSVMWVWLKMF